MCVAKEMDVLFLPPLCAGISNQSIGGDPAGRPNNCMRSLKVFCAHFPPVPIPAMRSIPRAPCRMAASASSWTSLDDITPVPHFFMSASFSGRSFSGQSSEAAGSASEMRRRFCLQPLLPLSQQSNAVAKNKNASQKCSFIIAWVQLPLLVLGIVDNGTLTREALFL